MTELEKIAYAKMFIDKLANGINPLDESHIPDGDVVNNVRLSRCFFYVSDILRQVIENGGITASSVREKRQKKSQFYLTAEQAKNFRYSDRPITASDIAERIMEIGPKEGVKKFPRSHIAKWFVAAGLLEDAMSPLGRVFKRPTALGEELGILIEAREGANGKYHVVVYGKEAQQLTIDNIDAIVAFTGQ